MNLLNLSLKELKAERRMENKEEKIYKILIDKKASKFLEGLSEPYSSSIIKAINSLSYNPHPYGYIKLKGEEAYRIRIGNYRVIYEVNENILTISIVKIGHRKDVYK